jgi:hypothetical protein
MVASLAPTTPKAQRALSRGILCEGCGGRFQPSRPNQKHCRPSCRAAASRKRQRRGGGGRFEYEADPGRPE